MYESGLSDAVALTLFVAHCSVWVIHYVWLNWVFVSMHCSVWVNQYLWCGCADSVCFLQQCVWVIWFHCCWLSVCLWQQCIWVIWFHCCWLSVCLWQQCVWVIWFYCCWQCLSLTAVCLSDQWSVAQHPGRSRAVAAAGSALGCLDSHVSTRLCAEQEHTQRQGEPGTWHLSQRDARLPGAARELQCCRAMNDNI